MELKLYLSSMLTGLESEYSVNKWINLNKQIQVN